MPANKFALLRYRIIDRTIRNTARPFPTKEDLREACEEALYGSRGDHISLSTIDKDIWAMRNEGELGYYAPIKFSKAEGGYYYDDPNYTISEVPLNDEDIEAIRFAATTLFQFRDIPMFAQFDHAIEKIVDRLNISSNPQDREVASIVSFESVSGYQGSVLLAPIFQAIGDRKTIRFQYRKFGSDEPAEYNLEPYLLKEYRNRWYVIGHRPGKGISTFGLERMSELIVTSELFMPKLTFDPGAYFKHSIGITAYEGKPETVRLAFNSEAAPYVLSQPIHSSQRIINNEGDGSVVEITVFITIELVMLILSYGNQVKVLSPTSLKERVKSELEECLRNYNAGDGN